MSSLCHANRRNVYIERRIDKLECNIEQSRGKENANRGKGRELFLIISARLPVVSLRDYCT